MTILLAAAAGYFLGSVSFPALIARAKGIDLRRTGSRKLGGSNLMRRAGVGWGIAGGVLDGVKGAAAVLAARLIGLDEGAQLLCGTAAVAGQMWPAFHGFEGGRANATGWGFCLAVDPLAATIMAVPILAAVAMRGLVPSHPTRLIPVGALASFAVWPAVIWEELGPVPRVLAGCAVLGLIVARRLSAGLRDDLATGAPLARILFNRALFDRSERQSRGEVAIS